MEIYFTGDIYIFDWLAAGAIFMGKIASDFRTITKLIAIRNTISSEYTRNSCNDIVSAFELGILHFHTEEITNLTLFGLLTNAGVSTIPLCQHWY